MINNISDYNPNFDNKNLITVGRFHEVKRYPLLIEIFSKLDEHLNLFLIGDENGDAKDKNNILLKIKELKLEKRVIMPGFLSIKEIEEYLKKSSIFLMTSSTEGLPVSMQEALSYGIPLIATDVGGVRELVDNSGILLSSNPEAREISDAIAYFIDLGEKRNEQSINAFELWKKRYNADTNVRFFTQKLECLMGNDENE